ncbi:ArsR/SmtB family transcription factor [Rhodococcus sp. MSC1_016]|jgi:DNA-binding transcriptional ArsR family regulator|uniref:ArsR/SmtB family transcription factor n=1 Tax=Rhodococcus sp. MSC1_016 TaxID=2909266 RepID=UPI002030532A|nr:metalloregulator ArsR/SmtB family transcription factor [Rhodococcus sp. MSC1_016]
MVLDVFTVVAEPQRRRILEQLRRGQASVGELVDVLDLSQPTVSKHLRVLRQAGFVACRTAAQHRIYSLHRDPFDELEAWLRPYRQLWDRHLDALGHHLDSKENRT